MCVSPFPNTEKGHVEEIGVPGLGPAGFPPPLNMPKQSKPRCGQKKSTSDKIKGGLLPTQAIGRQSESHLFLM
jgi:hypothetical protein